MSSVWTICRQEFTLHRRNRWVASFTVLFATLTLLVSWFGMVTSGYSGFQDFTRTAASLVNLAAFLIPLFALLLGVFSFITNRDYMDILVTQPVSRTRVLLGKYLGLVVTVLGASVLGFGVSGALIAISIGVQGARAYLLVVLYSSLLALVFTGLSVLISLLARRRQIALGIGLAVWVFYELLYGMIMLGTTLYLPPRVLKAVLLVGLAGNPIDVTRVLSLLEVGGPHLFGPAGATLVKLAGSPFQATLVGLGALLIWIAVPVLISIRIFNRQNL